MMSLTFFPKDRSVNENGIQASFGAGLFMDSASAHGFMKLIVHLL